MFSRSLRPLSARASPILSNTYLGPLCRRTLATDTETANTTTPTPLEKDAPRQLPYFVGRNNFNNLSVYQKKKRGGNLHLTLVKNGEGNLLALKEDLKDALKLSDDQIYLNSVTKHVVIKGHKRPEVVNFLRTAGF